MPTPEVLAAYEELEGGETQPETPAAPEPGVTPVEQFEYYLGDKASNMPANAEFSFKHNGEMMRIPTSKLINNFRSGSHLEEKLKAVSQRNEELTKYETEIGDFRKRESEIEDYKKLQEWSLANPAQFKYLWNNLNGGAPPVPGQTPGEATNPHIEGLTSMVTELRTELGEIKQWKAERAAMDHEEKIVADQKVVGEEALAFQEKFLKANEMSLDDINDQGISLKGQIMKYALDNNIPSFEVAGLGLLSGTLLERATVRGRTEAMKSVKGDAAAGIVSRVSTPGNGQSEVDVRRMDPDSRREMATAALLEAGFEE